MNVPVAYLNGEWLPVEEAKVSVLDRGFLFGDGVYEVIPVYNGKLFCLDRHVARLRASLAEIHLSEAVAEVAWVELLTEAVEKSGEALAAVYIQVTRGADTVRSFVYPADPTPTIFIMVSAAPQLGHREIKPLQLVTLEDFRWDRGHIKTISLIAAGMLKNEAIAAGANDALLVKNGEVTEATSANLFAVIGGVIVTPRKSTRLLHGITRDVVVELAKANGLPIEERVLRPEELEFADEIFISSSTMETWPVDRLDGKMIGNGEPGLVWQKVDDLFQAHKGL
ncbi:MAG: D-alanine transaminase [Candidatus Azotimanducaceae bacterium]